MTLLEIMVTMALFAVAFLYISEILRFHLKQQKKISNRIKTSRVRDNVFEILRGDLRNTLFFYDINAHFPDLYPVLSDSEELSLNPSEEEQVEPVNIMESQFDFSGDGQKLRFVSFISLPVSHESPPYPYVVKVEYFLKNCEDFRKGRSSRCLARAISRKWRDMNDDTNRNTTNLLSGVRNIAFSYFDGEEWHKEWSFSNRWKVASEKPAAKANLLPGLVRLELEWEDKKLFKASYDFSVSYSFLRSHYPGEISALAFLDIKRKKPEEKSPKEAEKGNEDSATPESPIPATLQDSAAPPNPTTQPQPPASSSTAAPQN